MRPNWDAHLWEAGDGFRSWAYRLTPAQHASQRDWLRQQPPCWVLSPERLGERPRWPGPAEYQWKQRYIRQSACPSRFAWLELRLQALPGPEIRLKLAPQCLTPEWGGSGTALADDEGLLYVLPGLLKGFADGVSGFPYGGFELTIEGLRLHLVDSHAVDFHHCLGEAFAELQRLAGSV